MHVHNLRKRTDFSSVTPSMSAFETCFFHGDAEREQRDSLKRFAEPRLVLNTFLARDLIFNIFECVSDRARRDLATRSSVPCDPCIVRAYTYPFGYGEPDDGARVDGLSSKMDTPDIIEVLAKRYAVQSSSIGPMYRLDVKYPKDLQDRKDLFLSLIHI